MVKRTQRLTMLDIADMAGVDKAVVSKVVNNAKTIPASREKVERVREIIRKYNYTPLSSAQSLATRCTRQIAFLLSDASEALLANPAFSLMLTGVVRGCQEHHYQCQVDICDFMNIHDFIVPENLRNRSIDGCILAGAMHDEALAKIAEIRMPIVVLGGRHIRQQVPIISRDSLKENVFFLDYALKKGHTRIWIASNSENAKHDFGILKKERPQMQIRLLNGPHKDEIVFAHHWTKRFLALPQSERPTLIFGADQFCCVMARELARNGVHCPEEISFMCFSDTEMAACYNPALTVYSERHSEVGYRGANLLIEILEKNLSPEEAIRLANSDIPVSNLIERESVRDLTEGGSKLKNKLKQT